MQKKEKEYDKRVAVQFHMMALCYKKVMTVYSHLNFLSINPLKTM